MMNSPIFHIYPHQEFPEQVLLKSSMFFQRFVNQIHAEAYKQTEKARIPSEAGLIARGKADALHYIVDLFEQERDLFNKLYALSVVFEQNQAQKAFEKTGVNVDAFLSYLLKDSPDPLGTKFGSPEFQATIKRMEGEAA